MSEGNEKSNGIIKAIVSSVVGLLGGAALMYLSPLVNNAIKPPRPVPNFSFSLEGLVGTFNNRSTGGTQGWWDFGDGSALEPFSPNLAAIVHKFPAPGQYTVKLSLHNLIGEEAERTVPVRIDSAAVTPSIEQFEVTPITSNRARASAYPSAPATFRITATLKGADLLIWSVDDHPLELFTDAGQGTIEHYVTFPSYGPKKIRLMAVSGRHKVEKQADVWVDVPDDDPMILIQQTSFAVSSRTLPVSVSFPAQYSGPSYPFEVSRRVGPDSTILEANIERPNENLVRDPRLVIAPDKKSFTITGELLRQTGSGGVPASWFTKVEMKVANKESQGARQMHPVSATLSLPGRTVVTLPPSTGMSTGLNWEIRQGMDIVCRDTKAPVTQIVRLRDRNYRVTVATSGNQIQVDATEATGVPAFQTSSPRRN